MGAIAQLLKYYCFCNKRNHRMPWSLYLYTKFYSANNLWWFCTSVCLKYVNNGHKYYVNNWMEKQSIKCQLVRKFILCILVGFSSEHQKTNKPYKVDASVPINLTMGACIRFPSKPETSFICVAYQVYPSYNLII